MKGRGVGAGEGHRGCDEGSVGHGGDRDGVISWDGK